MDKEKKKFGVFKYILVLAVLVILGNSLVICREDEYLVFRCPLFYGKQDTLFFL